MAGGRAWTVCLSYSQQQQCWELDDGESVLATTQASGRHALPLGARASRMLNTRGGLVFLNDLHTNNTSYFST